jgi:hypothetical protein
MLESDAEYFEKLKAKGWKIIPSKNKLPLADKKIKMEKVTMEQPNKFKMDSTVKVIRFVAIAYDGSAEALKDDNKISVLEILGLAAKLVPRALELPGALPYVVDEIVFDKISEEDAAQLVSAFDEAKNLKGDTRDAVKELLPILADLKNWGFKWFGTSTSSV